MVHLLAKIMIKSNSTEEERRQGLGMVCGIVGIFLNILLFAGKLFAGLLSGAVSIMADAFNNLSDAGSSLVTLLGFRLAGQKPDSEHPYGHGRMEYLAALVVSAIIVVMGFELLKESIQKILHPEATELSLVVLVILLASIGVKCYMAFYNFKVGEEIASVAVKATAKDSLSDCIATSVVLLCAILGHFFGLQLDGWAGVVVSGFIFYAGISACREAIDPLLGIPPEPEYIERIEGIVTGFDENIVGVHDLCVHDYGPGRKFISLHAEVPADGDILELHDIIDNLEKQLAEELGCVATIHMDPVDIKDPRVAELKEKVRLLVKEIQEDATIHDFRVVFGETHTNLIFDIAIGYSCKLSDAEIAEQIEKMIQQEIGPNYFTVIEIDRDYFINR